MPLFDSLKSSRYSFPVAALICLAALFYAYSGHFHNPFHFDDAHTIVTNTAIRDWKNIPRFFKDASLTSSLPANQSYRPGLNVLNTIDFMMGGKPFPDPFYYHVSIFSAYVFLGVLLYLMLVKLFDKTHTNPSNRWISLLATSFYMIHTANAETVNYITSRTDLYSTLFVVLSFVLYLYVDSARKYHLYLITLVLGFTMKEQAIMFAPLLVLYAWLYEQHADLSRPIAEWAKIWKGIKSGLPSLFLGIILFIISRKMTPSTFVTGGTDSLHYLATQTFVMVHYVNNFLFPFNLSADTDWVAIEKFSDTRVFAGTLFCIGLLYLAFRCSSNRMWRPVSFGILWFFIALLPTSSIFPWAEVLNDHRVFFPYIGLAIATVWSFSRWVAHLKSKGASPVTMAVLTLLPLCVLSAHVYGVKQRCKVWSSGETLWKDVTEKSPNNARGLMNYGNALMGKADYEGALAYFEKAKSLWPRYSYVYVNLGVLKSAMNKPDEAESNFRYAMQLNNTNPECYYYYAGFLMKQSRYKEAMQQVQAGLALSPNHANLTLLKQSIQNLPAGEFTSKLELAQQLVKEKPSPENWLNLSLEFYYAKEYEKCAEAAREALKLRPNYDLAYNNICSAYNMLEEWDKAIDAGKKAVALNPTSQLAKNNLAVSLKGKESSKK